MGIVQFLIGLVVLVVFLKIISLPFKIIWKIIVNSILGLIVMYVVGFFGFIIPTYSWTWFCIGLFGLPGFLVNWILAFILI